MAFRVSIIRIHGFRGLQDIEIPLDPTTLLTGMNNAGKTTVLKALQLVFGNRSFVTKEDFGINQNNVASRIVVDVLIVPVSEDGDEVDDFSPEWEALFTTDRIKFTSEMKSIVPVRVVVSENEAKGSITSETYSMAKWPLYQDGGTKWYEYPSLIKKRFGFEEIPFFYVNAQRDIVEDTGHKSSYLGRLLSGIEYSPQDTKDIEMAIAKLNQDAVAKSEILGSLKETLGELDTAIGASDSEVEISPFTKNIRDLNKGVAIYYTSDQDSFPMQYQGMGTRSWSSLLTLKSYVKVQASIAASQKRPFFPIMAVEEPESHLHPNAQKQLFSQIESIVGQKVISSHSPYIAAVCPFGAIRNIYKNKEATIGRFDEDKLSAEEVRKIRRFVIHSRGELFFAKAVLLFEGESEEQALPILSEKYFGKSQLEVGVDFVGVSGFKNYKPFLELLESLCIPWVLLSDAEPNVKGEVVKQVKNFVNEGDIDKYLVFLDDGNDFEDQLFTDGYRDEIIKGIVQGMDFHNDQHKKVKLLEIESWTDAKMLEVLQGGKTKYAPLIAEEINNSGKNIPSHVSTALSILAEKGGLS